MAKTRGVDISVAVEGSLDEAVVRRLILHAGAIPGRIYGKKGKEHIRQSLRGYNQAPATGPGLFWWTLITVPIVHRPFEPNGCLLLRLRCAFGLQSGR